MYAGRSPACRKRMWENKTHLACFYHTKARVATTPIMIATRRPVESP